MVGSGCSLNDFVRDPCDIVRDEFVISCADSQLAFVTAATEKQSADIIHECGVTGASAHVFNVGLEVLVKVD